MSNLIVNPVQTPDFNRHQAQTVNVQDLGRTVVQAADNNDEIDLRELWRALRRRKNLVGVTAAGVLALSGLNTAYQRIFRPVYQGSFALLITDPLNNESGNRAAAAALDGGMFEELARNTTSNDIPTLIELLQSPLLLSPIAQRYDLNANALAKRITITTGGEKRKEAEGILNVSVTGRDPVEDKQLLDDLSSTYLQAALQQRQQRLSDGLNFLNKQAPALEAKTEEIQSEVSDFRQRHSLLEPTTEGGALKQREAAIAAQVLDLEAGRNRLLRVRQEIANGTLTARGFQEAIGGLGNGTTAGGDVQGLTISDVDQSLLQQLLKVETELAEARAKYNPDSSMVRGLEARLNQLQPLLRKNQLEAVDAALNLNAGRLETAKAQETSLNNQFLKQPALIKQYEALQTRLKIAQQNLTGLVTARENFQLEIAQRSVPWRVIDPPEINPNPIKPSIPRNLALGAVLGLVAGAAAGLLRDRMDHVFHHAGEVKMDLGLPLLGHIPHVDLFKGVREDKRFLLQELDINNPSEEDQNTKQKAKYQRFFYQEAFRNLFTSIRFLNSDQPLRSIAITSSLPAEGKSLVNVLLAKTLSEMGQKVLLIDADLRKPKLHTRLGLNNLRGLTNVLTDDSNSWRSVLQPVEGYENWSVITAGRRPPDPARLLSSNRLHQLVEDLENSGEFDLILFDTAPVLGLADAALVAEHCDGLVLMVSLDRVDRSLPKEAVARILSSGAPLLGVVTNCIKREEKGAQAYGFGQYDQYGYGYGGYGYGGYGYAAYDTTAAYAYYANDDETQTAGAARQDKRTSNTNLKSKLRQRRIQLMHWLDN
ncbi:GumC family protein [Synechococcus sp. MIT S9507]|uniref:GumC family protein n=1 Tax=Synechococcus sp. MIT S9507 TaxID=3082544 RepID=UPI0039B56994